MGSGCDVTLAADCHTTDDLDWEGVKIAAEQIVKHVNLVIRYSQYPDQAVRVFSHTEIADGGPTHLRSTTRTRPSPVIR